jgi:hypothetical protein
MLRGAGSFRLIQWIFWERGKNAWNYLNHFPDFGSLWRTTTMVA